MIAIVMLAAMLQTDPQFDRCVTDAMAVTSQGWSSDEVLLRDDRRAALVAEVQRSYPSAASGEVFQALLRLRKAGKLGTKGKQRPPGVSDQAIPAGEIAARVVLDQAGGYFDDVLTDDRLLAEFDREAKRVAPEVSAYEARRAALRLRKTRRLQPELVLRVVDWQRTIVVYELDSVRKNADQIPELPGVYLFRDGTGYLYIGEAQNLRERLRQHVIESDRQSLEQYLTNASGAKITIEIHSFPSDSPAATLRMRRAYESELIASRQPRFNVRP